MYFKGDIIITDPCYIMKKKTGKPTINDYEILKGKGSKLFSEYTDEENAAYKELEAARMKWEKENPDDWDTCDYGDNMEALGFTNYLTSDTGYGDWSCTTLLDSPETPEVQKKLLAASSEMFYEYNFTGKTAEEKKDYFHKRQAEIDQMEKDSGIVLGHFCADAGLVSVFLLDEILKYNPDFNYHIERPHTTTLIKDFDGEIIISSRDYEYLDEETNVLVQDDEVSVMGTGNINFYTTQTGL